MATDDQGIRVLIWDDTEGRPVGWTWDVGAPIYKLIGRFDLIINGRSWETALDILVTELVERGTWLRDLRFWGHGNWGRAYLRGGALTSRSLTPEGRLFPHLESLARFVRPESLIWFRTCSSFGNVMGRAFAKALAAFFQCTVAGHTYNIGFWHSGLHTLRPLEDPSWSEAEGTVMDEKGTRQTTWSAWGRPNTVTFVRGSIPKGW